MFCLVALSPVHVLSSQYFFGVFNLFLLSCDVGLVNGALNSMLVGGRDFQFVPFVFNTS